MGQNSLPKHGFLEDLHNNSSTQKNSIQLSLESTTKCFCVCVYMYIHPRLYLLGVVFYVDKVKLVHRLKPQTRSLLVAQTKIYILSRGCGCSFDSNWLPRGTPTWCFFLINTVFFRFWVCVCGVGLWIISRIFVAGVSSYCSKNVDCPVLVIKRDPKEAPEDPMDD